MISVGKNHRIERDKYQWVLSTRKVGANPKTGARTESWKNTFHANLEQLANKILNEYAMDRKTVEELAETFKQASELLVTKIESEV